MFEVPRFAPGQAGSTRLPGLPVLEAGIERHVVPAGGARAIDLESGDEVALEDRFGMQPCEVAFLDSKGEPGLSALGLRPDTSARFLNSLLQADSALATRLGALLKNAGARTAIPCGLLFGPDSPRGAVFGAVAETEGKLVAAAPAPAMAPDGGMAPSEVIVWVKRARPRNRPYRLDPPPPLAEPLQDFNLEPGSARGYEVRAGQYIQILDVQGRECSDFQAWDLRALDRGVVQEIDPTTTRSMTGSLYPLPGLYSKYFSVEQTPLVEIVQDTVGRHDAFNLACTARYYEDLGYPGHVNCSDNLNIEARQFGIAARPGWPAINFFYNTALDDPASVGIGMDDPWSRPGDYVLLRALTDLMCFSTACPCDVDPANAWYPTDIQVRVYDEKKPFHRALAHRRTPDSEPVMTRETAFHSQWSSRTRNFVDYAGYWLPQDFTAHGAVDEYWACRERAALIDLSPLRKCEVLGPDAETLLQRCVTRDVSRLAVGQVVYSAMCYEHGGMIDDGTVYRLAESNYRWVGGSDDSALWLQEKADELGLHCWVKPSTDQIHNLALQGPESREILKECIWTPPGRPAVDELEWFRFTVGRIGGYEGPALLVSRTGYTGELGYELFCHPNDGEAVFDAVWKAGEPRGLAPCGLAALDMLRIEAGLAFAGCEFDDQTDPFEAGIGFTVALKSTNAPFVGREALERRKSSPARRLVGLDVEGGGVPAGGAPVMLGRAKVGEVTSATRSPKLERVIALARLDVAHAELGTSLEIGQLDGMQKRIPVKVTRFPHYDPDKTRVRS